MPSNHARAGFTGTYLTLPCVPSTLNAIYKVLLVGSDVQILNDRVESWNGRGFHHRCLFQAAYAGLWWKGGESTPFV